MQISLGFISKRDLLRGVVGCILTVWLCTAFSACGAKPPSPPAPMHVSKTIALARPLQAHETAHLLVQLGEVPRGAKVLVSDASGNMLGRIAPFPARDPGQDLEYTVPVPTHLLEAHQVTVQIQVQEPAQAARAPRAGEVLATRLSIVEVGKP